MSRAASSRTDALAGVSHAGDAIQAAQTIHQAGGLADAAVARELALHHLVGALVAAVVYVGDAIREAESPR